MNTHTERRGWDIGPAGPRVGSAATVPIVVGSAGGPSPIGPGLAAAATTDPNRPYQPDDGPGLDRPVG
jgi:hypothetical protein